MDYQTMIYEGNNMTKPFSYEYYKKIVDKYREFDCREINFQNRVVIPLLESLFIDFEDIWIVDISLQGRNKNSVVHDVSKYRSLKEYSASPDVLIVSDWNYKNKDVDSIIYHAVVEVKSPEINPLFKNKKHTLDQVRYHLEANKKVVLTDCLKWEFYERGKAMVSIALIEQNGKEEWTWKTRKENDDIWGELCAKIQTFINV